MNSEFRQNPHLRPTFPEIFKKLSNICADACPDLEKELIERKEREREKEKEREDEVKGYEVELEVDWQKCQVHFPFFFLSNIFLTPFLFQTAPAEKEIEKRAQEAKQQGKGEIKKKNAFKESIF